MPLNQKEKKREAGVLLHISSLPSKGATGDLGESAYQMVDILAEMGVSVWQTLPINMPHADLSPYQCISAFAGNIEFICLDKLVEQKLLKRSDVNAFNHSDMQHKNVLLAHAYTEFIANHDQSSFIAFCEEESAWLEDYALFVVLRNQFDQKGWCDWPEQYKNRETATLEATKMMLSKEIVEVQFVQYLFFEQWKALKTYANSKKIKLFGDIPIFVAYDSAEVWANPSQFKLDTDKNMTVVAGVPPDYFSETGQRWGNPHYAWDVMAEDGYAWWVSRLAKQNVLFDLVRIDHFRGLEAAWEIKSSEETAINGEWVIAPGDALLQKIYKALPDIHLVAEDLGIITPEVDALRLKYQMPGMKILQFAFGGDETNPYLPENIDENSVVYTGTHDNDTTLGWYHSAQDHVKDHFHQFVAQENPNMPYTLMDMALSTKANLAIVPMQDILGLDSDARMNTPGTIVNNWQWRFEWSQLTKESINAFKTLVEQSDRYPIAMSP
jgi:4-alpha-glucanotransferase